MTSQNVVMAYPDYCFPDSRFTTVAFSGGSWLPALPLSNLGTLPFADVARSTNLLLASTQFWADLGVARDVRLIAIPRSNGSRSCSIRARGFPTQSTSGTCAADTGWRPLYPQVYPACSLPWGNPSLWDGLMSPEDFLIWPMPWVALLPTAAIARYWLIEISDATNAAGYFQLPRIVLARGWQPSMNFAYGMSLLNSDPTVVQTSQGGADYFADRPTRRIARFSVNLVPAAEAMSWANDMQYRLGTSGQLYLIMAADEPQNMHRRAFLGRMSSLSPLVAASFGRIDSTYEITEVVA